MPKLSSATDSTKTNSADIAKQIEEQKKRQQANDALQRWHQAQAAKPRVTNS